MSCDISVQRLMLFCNASQFALDKPCSDEDEERGALQTSSLSHSFFSAFD